MKRDRGPQARSGGGEWMRALLAIPLLAAPVTHAQPLLPPPPPRPADAGTLGSPARLFVREFQFEGNTAFTASQLSAVTRPFTGRELTTEDLEQARRTVTLHYVNQGYVNSGAVLPDQTPTNGVVRLRIIEGVLTGVDLHGTHRFSASHVKRRLRRGAAAPLNLNRLQDSLQLLRQDPNIRQVNAEVRPGARPGESRLDLRVTEQPSYRAGLQFDNQRPPSVGDTEIWALLADLNLTGHSDPLDVRYGIANSGAHGMEFSGIDNVEGSYTFPVTRVDTTLSLHGSRLNTGIIEEPFSTLGISSLTSSYGLTVRQPFYRTSTGEAALSVGFDRRENRTWVLDQPFSLAPGAVNGAMNISVLRVSQEYLHRGQNHVLALRSSFNVGLDAFEATDDRVTGDPNGRFVSWLGQGQYVHRLFQTQNEVLLRVTGQWTPDPLLALEQLSVGGYGSVRGYPENQLVRDRGAVSSLEFHLPIAYNRSGAPMVQLAPFFDYGAAWNLRASPSPTTLYSAGSGLLVNVTRHVAAQLYWGYRLRHVTLPDSLGAQGLGLSFRVTLQAF